MERCAMAQATAPTLREPMRAFDETISVSGTGTQP